MDWIVLLAGGSGSRFWPLSTPGRPKQLLPLLGPRSTAETMLAGLAPLVPPDRTLVVTNAALAPAFMNRLGLPPENVLAEPCARSTGPALVWANEVIAARDPAGTLVSLHADWHLPQPEAFQTAVHAALTTARATDRLITVGIAPIRPDVGFGYVLPGAPLPDSGGAYEVRRFVEKPPPADATRLIAEGARWNSGIFAWTVERFRLELARHAPELAEHLPLLAGGDPRRFFEAVPSLAIDHALFERSDRIAMLPGTFAWDDVGTWDALYRIRDKDAAGNVCEGPTILAKTEGTLVWSDGMPVVVSGVRDLVIVATNGRVLILPRGTTSTIKELLDTLPPEVRAL